MPTVTFDPTKNPKKIVTLENIAELESAEDLLAQQSQEPEYVELSANARAEIKKSWSEMLQPTESPVSKAEVLETKVLTEGTIKFNGALKEVESIKQASDEAKVEATIETQTETDDQQQTQREEKLIDFPLLGSFLKDRVGVVESWGKSAYKTGKEAAGSIWDLVKYAVGIVDIYYRPVNSEPQETDPKKLEKKAIERKKSSIKQAFFNGLRAAQRVLGLEGSRRKQITAEGANKNVGLQEGYQGSLDDEGGLRIDLQTAAWKKSSEILKWQKRQEQVARARAMDPTGGIRLDTVAEGGRLSSTGGGGAG